MHVECTYVCTEFISLSLLYFNEIKHFFSKLEMMGKGCGTVVS